ncbi:uncharacterized protein At1g76070-like [Vicia villosa]|uniref:uncharacterized protein At1g76070-like n=1 Tax=Vicia villosa TaxID=3911 RepID=UPI00273CDCFD|nr:uncharacterized protein At1g76070-like [Vicia villosa]
MEQLLKIKTTILKFITKQPVSISLVTFQNPTLSPCRSPMTHVVSLFPKEARRKQKRGISFSPKEPTSPKVSCMGQVNCKKKKKKMMKEKEKKLHKGVQQVVSTKKNDSVRGSETKVMVWISKGSFEGRKEGGEDKTSAMVGSAPPSLDAMKKFTSGRGSLYDFDATLSER